MTEKDEKLCECHSFPMKWIIDERRKRGGYWRCRIKLRENEARYSKKHLEKVRLRKRIFRSKQYWEVIRNDPIRMMKINTQKRIRYHEKQLGEE